MAVGFVAVFLLSCAMAVRQAAPTFLPTQAEASKLFSGGLASAAVSVAMVAESLSFFDRFSTWAGSSLENISDDQPSIYSCYSNESTLVDESQDLDDAITNRDGIGFFLWVGIVQDTPGVYLPVLGWAISKIPIRFHMVFASTTLNAKFGVSL